MDKEIPVTKKIRKRRAKHLEFLNAVDREVARVTLDANVLTKTIVNMAGYIEILEEHIKNNK